MNRIQDIVEITESFELMEQLSVYEDDLDKLLKPLQDLLEINILSDNVSVAQHCVEVERWRERIAKQLSLAIGFAEFSKSSNFTLPKSKDVTEHDRDAYKKRNSAGFVAIQKYLEELISSIDSRVNLCKKMLETKVAG